MQEPTRRRERQMKRFKSPGRRSVSSQPTTGSEQPFPSPPRPRHRQRAPVPPGRVFRMLGRTSARCSCWLELRASIALGLLNSVGREPQQVDSAAAGRAAAESAAGASSLPRCGRWLRQAPHGRIEKLDPDLRVREAIGFAFARFAEMQSIGEVFLSLRADRIALPYAATGWRRAGAVRSPWRRRGPGSSRRAN